MTRWRRDDGSALVLTLGYAALTIALILVCADATSLYLARKRTDAAADAAALAGAEGYSVVIVDRRPVARLSDVGVRTRAEQVIAAHDSLRLVAARTPDGTTARVTVATTWHAPLLALFAPGGVVIESTASARTAIS